MREPDAIKIGPLLDINGRRYHWCDYDLLDDAFNKVATVQDTYHIYAQKHEYVLIVFKYEVGYRYIKKKQALPMAEDLETAQRMAVPILTFLLEN